MHDERSSRKIADHPGCASCFAEPLARVARLLAQQMTDHGKLYALHAPEVECPAKGKAHKRYEFGVKVSVAVTNRVLGLMALPGNPYDGHTLGVALDRVERMTGVAVVRAYVCGVTPTIRREQRRRSAIEPVIGHMKSEGRLDRNFLAGPRGDAINCTVHDIVSPDLAGYELDGQRFALPTIPQPHHLPR